MVGDLVFVACGLCRALFLLLYFNQRLTAKSMQQSIKLSSRLDSWACSFLMEIFILKTLVEDIASHFARKYPPHVVDYPSTQYGLIRSCFFDGLDSYEEIVHSVCTREVIVHSSRGLSEPGTLFKNLMAILRDVVICYDGTVRNACSNGIIQFEYGVNAGPKSQTLFPAGEPVGVLAATAMSNPAYKAVLDSTPSSNNSWELMKEILLCKVSFKNELADRRVIFYLNDCGCSRNYCQEKAAYLLKNHLEKVSLKDIAKSFMVEYKGEKTVPRDVGIDTGLVGHVHFEKASAFVIMYPVNNVVDEVGNRKAVVWEKTFIQLVEEEHIWGKIIGGANILFSSSVGDNMVDS